MGFLTAKDKAEMAERAEENKRIRREAVRDQIQVDKIVKLLQDHVLGKGRAKMTPARVKLAEMLLNKSLPDLAVAKADVEAKQVVFNLTTVYNAPPQAKPIPIVAEVIDVG
jgi:hypothetical protein